MKNGPESSSGTPGSISILDGRVDRNQRLGTLESTYSLAQSWERAYSPLPTDPRQRRQAMIDLYAVILAQNVITMARACQREFGEEITIPMPAWHQVIAAAAGVEMEIHGNHEEVLRSAGLLSSTERIAIVPEGTDESGLARDKE